MTELIPGGGRRPSSLSNRSLLARRRPVGLAQLSDRYDSGRDLWSGAPLEGEDAIHWLMTLDKIEVKDTNEKRGERKAALMDILEVINESSRRGSWIGVDLESAPPFSFSYRHKDGRTGIGISPRESLENAIGVAETRELDLIKESPWEGDKRAVCSKRGEFYGTLEIIRG